MTSPGGLAPRRPATTSPLRRLSRTVLIIGTVLAATATFGPVWVVRLGLLVAVVAAIMACTVAWREVAENRRDHAEAMLAASRAHGSALSEERRRNASVVDTLAGRADEAAAENRRHQVTIGGLRGSVGTLQGEVGSLKNTIVRLNRDAGRLHGTVDTLNGEVATLRDTVTTLRVTIEALRGQLSTLRLKHQSAPEEIRQREATITSLRETVRAREAELIALSAAAGQVRAIPRRVLAEHESAWEALPEASELRSDGPTPSVADLADGAVFLPNYEGERKRA